MGFPPKLGMIRVIWRWLRVYFLYKFKISSQNQLFAKKINLIQWYVIANLQQLSQYNSNQHQTSFSGDFTSLATSRLGRIIE